MNIHFLGTGGAFDINFGNSSAIVTKEDDFILIDCGFSIFPRLVKEGLANQINKVVITHLHDDHVGGLSSLILYYYFKLNLGKITIIYPNETFKEELIAFLSLTTGEPEKYANFKSIECFTGLSYIDTTNKHINGMHSYGYTFSDKDQFLVYSGDIADGNFIFNWLKNNDIKEATVFHDISFLHDGVHTFYKDLIPHLTTYTIYGYHCDPNANVHDNQIPLIANCPRFLLNQETLENRRKDVSLFITKRA